MLGQETNSKWINEKIWSDAEGIFHSQFFSQFLKWQLNDMIRGKKILTVASIQLNDKEEQVIPFNIIEAFSACVKGQVRTNDFVFATDQPNRFLVILPYSGIREVQFFIQRLEGKIKEQPVLQSSSLYLVKGLLEITDGRFSTERIANEIDYIHNLATIGEQHYEVKILRSTEPNPPLKVAIVDSNELLHAVLDNLLMGLNIPQTTFELSHFYNGEDYLKSKIYSSSNLQLVLISDILPERDGIEVLQQLRAQPNEAKYFVIVLGSRNTEEEMVFAMEQGADDYISKPFNVNLLAVKIKRLLKRGI